MQPDPGLVAVHDPDDAFEHMRFVRDLGESQNKSLFVPITPGANNSRAVGADIMKALGKDPDLIGAGRNGTETWLRAATWLEVAGIEELFISRAHLISKSLLEQLAGLACRSGLRLWLIFQTTSFRRSQEQFLGNWPLARMEFDQFVAIWGTVRKKSRRSNRARPASRAARLPEVPMDDFTSFRAACRSLLDQRGFAQVDEEFLKAFRHTRDHLNEVQNPSESSICTHVRDLIADSEWMPELLTRVRGSQVAAFNAGYLMKVNLDVLSTTRVARVHLDEEVLAVLERYSTPRYAALAVLLVVSGAQLIDLVNLDLADIDEGGAAVRVAGRTHQLPPRGAALVQALVHERLGQMANASDPLFVYIQGTGRKHGALLRWTVRGMFDNLKKMERETGLLLTAHLADGGQREAVAWARRRGISLQRI